MSMLRIVRECVVLATVLVGCTGGGSASGARAPADEASRDSLHPVQFRFVPSDEERTVLNRSLNAFRRIPEAPDLSYGGELYRFDTAGDRYLLLTLAETEAGVIADVLLFILNPRLDHLSEGYRVRLPDYPGNHFSVAAITDVDGNGEMDVVYCVWGLNADQGQPHALEFRGGRWREFIPGSVELPTC